jgi:hypothetical protein
MWVDWVRNELMYMDISFEWTVSHLVDLYGLTHFAMDLDLYAFVIHMVDGDVICCMELWYVWKSMIYVFFVIFMWRIVIFRGCFSPLDKVIFGGPGLAAENRPVQFSAVHVCHRKLARTIFGAWGLAAENKEALFSATGLWPPKIITLFSAAFAQPSKLPPAR